MSKSVRGISPICSQYETPDTLNRLANYNLVSRPFNEEEIAPMDPDIIFDLYSIPVCYALSNSQDRMSSAYSVFEHLPRHVFGRLSPRARLVLLFAIVAILWFQRWRWCG